MAGETTVECGLRGLLHRIEELPPGTATEWWRRGSLLAERRIDSVRRTAALPVTAPILCVPANIDPILRMRRYGARTGSPIRDGCVLPFRNDGRAAAVLVILAGIPPIREEPDKDR